MITMNMKREITITSMSTRMMTAKIRTVMDTVTMTPGTWREKSLSSVMTRPG